ncbi:transposase [Micromonospora sp. NPDC049679]|uniref:transposase n=1 Tax=Micromonospora sp. NPDC049679 TaxID=3155920 RepID=UPI0033DEC9F3
MPDGLWRRIEPLLPKPERRRRFPGRNRIPDRQVLCGILSVLHTEIQWEFLPGLTGSCFCLCRLPWPSSACCLSEALGTLGIHCHRMGHLSPTPIESMGLSWV